MDAERWREVDNLLQAALAQRPEDRDAFLRGACAHDQLLESETRSLLRSHLQAGRFLEDRAIDVVARALALEQNRNAPVTDDRLIGQVVSHYRILTRLGGGGMGVVYKAEDTRLQRCVALKFLSDESSRDPAALRRFRREAQAASALNHPNICTVHDIGEQGDRSFIVIEYLDGVTLKQRLADGPLDVELLLALGIEMADGLDAAHSAGVVHRDIKPANVFITPLDHAKILDFGLAQLDVRDDGGAEPLTRTGIAVGTPGYMSPEQVLGRPVDARSDLFSLGLLLYEMATGTRPVAGQRLNTRVFPQLDAIINRCLENDLGLRYQHASDIRTDLRRLKADSRADSNIRTAGALIARPWKLCVAGAAAVLMVIEGASFYHRPRVALTTKDTLVLADFINTTGDAVFDGTLRQGLAIQLEQSPFLGLISDERIQRALALMGKPAEARLTAELAREICVRTGSAAVLDGSIAALGTHYVLGLRARQCRSGEILDEEQVQATRKEDVLSALSQAARTFRTRVGESLATIERHDMPLAEATTPSLDALKAYNAASTVLSSARELASAVPLFKRALAIDPQFAMAYASLGLTYGLLGEPTLSAESSDKAYQLRDRASDRERFFITATYDLQVTGNLERAAETCELWVQTYPRDTVPLTFLGGFVYPTFGRYEKAVEAATRAIELDEDFGIAYYQLSFNAAYLNRLDLSEHALQQASERKLDVPESLLQRYDLAFLKHDQAAMERTAALSVGMPGTEDLLAARQGFVLAYSGQRQAAKALMRRAVSVADQEHQQRRSALFVTGAALWDAFFGDAAAARQGAQTALARSTDRDVEYGTAFALALSGDSSGAEAIAIDLERRFAEDTSVRLSYVPVIRALTAINRGHPEGAITLLETGARYDLGTPLASAPPGFFGIFYPVYVRGLAYLAAKQGAKAAEEFQRILNHPGIVVSDPVGALARLQLARAFVLSGESAKAKDSFQSFLTLWDAADADIPIFAQAQAEHARLQ